MLKLNHRFDKNRIGQLLLRGVRQVDMIGRKEIHLDTALTAFQHKGVGLRPVEVSIKKQLKVLRTLHENPLESYRCVGIASYPSDLMAKRIAIWLFERALSIHQKRAATQSVSRTPPLWHTVYGGYVDKLRDGDERPSQLVISNVTMESTAYKVEKVRDLLEKYHDIPRIVVLGGSDPLTFFRQRLSYPIDAAIYVGGTGKELTSEDVDL